MQALFETLSHGVEGTALIALTASFVWGVLSILLSPCHLASIPLIIGFIDGQGNVSTRRAFGLSALFGGGILVTIALTGAITAAAGRMLGDVGAYGNYFVAGIFFIVGLHLMGIFRIPLPGVTNVGIQRKGYLAAALLGLIFGIALGPCTFAYMAPVLAVALKMSGKAVGYAILLLLSYGIGHCAVIVVAGTSSRFVSRYLTWSNSGWGREALRGACGVLVLAGGLYLIYSA